MGVSPRCLSQRPPRPAHLTGGDRVLGLLVVFKQIGVRPAPPGAAPGTLPAAEGQGGSGPGVVAWVPRGLPAAWCPRGLPLHAHTSAPARSGASDLREAAGCPQDPLPGHVPGGLLTALTLLSLCPWTWSTGPVALKRGNDAEGPAVVQRPLAEPLWDALLSRGVRGAGWLWAGGAPACQGTQDSFLWSAMMSSDFSE